MEIFIANLDSRTTKQQLTHLLNPTLQRFKIHIFDVRKRNDRPFAKLTILDTKKAHQLLAHAAQSPHLVCSPSGKYANITISRNAPDAQLLKVLQKEEKDLTSRQAWQKLAKPDAKVSLKQKEPDILALLSLESGRWETSTGSTIFVPYYFNHCSGSVTATSQALLVKLDTSSTHRYDLVMPFYNICSVSLSKTAGKRTLTLTLDLAPQIYEDERLHNDGNLESLLQELTTGVGAKKQTLRYRETSLPNMSPTIAGTCLTYRLTFRQDLSQFKQCVQRMTSYQIPIARTAELAERALKDDHTYQVSMLESSVVKLKCSFRWRYQIQALWANASLSPQEVRLMLPTMKTVRERSGEETLIEVISRTALQLEHIDASTNAITGGFNGAIATMQQQEKFFFQEEEDNKLREDEVSVHRVLVTPTGLYLSGPEPTAANRVLRQYRAHQDCFLRVLFADENEERIQFDKDVSTTRILRGRFLPILRKGLDIAGEHFDFLGFSHSSLRSQSCWFMRPFIHNGTLMFAKNLVSQLGDFSQIRCPAKCAARIGQAFSESSRAVQINPKTVRIISDVQVGDYTFTDGCGTMSPAIWKLLRAESAKKQQPTSYQIRYKGAKGMLTLDSSLAGVQIQLRESMVKFTGSPSNDLEICGTNARPLQFKLNRLVIKILEDLGVPASVFENLQDKAIQDLRLSARSPSSATDFVNKELSDSSTGLPKLLRCLQKIRIDISDDSFLRDVLGALLQVQLREIKYRTRIPVPEAKTLYGISDETATLKEGQVFVTFTPEDSARKIWLRGPVAVTRSPALHPGDIQLVQAVVPSKGSSTEHLRNCIIFSQQGRRDVPSMLSGGDLDGDLYNVMYDKDLLPKKTVSPADYVPPKPIDIGRKVTTEDMTEFFIDFMENDQLGRIASLHQVFADLNGTMSAECLLLAELHSTAVDFSKSGVPVDVKKIPRPPPYRPDFMAPSASTKVEKGIKRPAELAPPEGNQRYRYYESDRVLGKLYRAVDEDIFFQDLEDDTTSMFSAAPGDTVLIEIMDWVKAHIGSNKFMQYKDLATEVRDYYDSNMLQIMSRYATFRTDQLTEKEVYIGTILGRSGAGSRFQREQSHNMNSRFNIDLRDIKHWMKTHTEKDGDDGYRNLCAACLWHAVNMESNVDKKLQSFGWFAAALCVPQVLGQAEEELSEW